MAQPQYNIDGKLFVSGYVPDASSFTEYGVENVQEVPEYTFTAPFALDRQTRNTIPLSRPQEAGPVHKLYYSLAQHRQSIFEQNVSVAERINDGYQPWLARFRLDDAGALDTAFDEGQKSPEPVVLRHELEEPRIYFEIRGSEDTEGPMYLEIQRHINPYIPRYDYFIINNELQGLKINGYQAVRDRSVIGPLPDFSIIEVEDDVVFWWRTEEAFNPRPTSKRKVAVESNDIQQPPRKKQLRGSDVDGCQERLARNLRDLERARDKYKKRFLPKRKVGSKEETPRSPPSGPQDPPDGPPGPPELGNGEEGQPPADDQLGHEDHRPETPNAGEPPAPPELGNGGEHQPPTSDQAGLENHGPEKTGTEGPSPSDEHHSQPGDDGETGRQPTDEFAPRNPSPDAPPPEATSSDSEIDDAPETLQSLAFAGVDRGQWMEAFNEFLREELNPICASPQYDATDAYPYYVETGTPMTLGEVFLAIASFLLPLNQWGCGISLADITISADNWPKVRMPIGFSGPQLLLVTRTMEHGQRGQTIPPDGDPFTDFAIVSATFPLDAMTGEPMQHTEVAIVGHESDRFKFEADRVYQAVQATIPQAWLLSGGTPDVRFIRSQARIVQHTDPIYSGVHAVLNAWALMLGVEINGQNVRIAPEHAGETYNAAYQLINRALQGRAEAKHVELFLYAYGFAQIPSTYEQWRSAPRYEPRKHVASILMNLDVLKNFCNEVGIAKNPTDYSLEQLGLPELPVTPRPVPEPPRPIDPGIQARPSVPQQQPLRLTGTRNIYIDEATFAIASLWAALYRLQDGANFSFSDPVSFSQMASGRYAHNATYVGGSDTFIIPVIIAQADVQVARHECSDAHSKNFWPWQLSFNTNQSPSPDPETQSASSGEQSDEAEPISTYGGVGHIVLAVARRVSNPAHNVKIEVFDSLYEDANPYTERYVRNVVKNSGWFGDTAPRFAPTTHTTTVKQGTGSNTCGIHTILNAWAVMLGLRPRRHPNQLHYHRPHHQTAAQEEENFYNSALGLVNRALSGQATIYSIRTFLAFSRLAEPVELSPRESDPDHPDNSNTVLMNEAILQEVVQQMRQDLSLMKIMELSTA